MSPKIDRRVKQTGADPLGSPFHAFYLFVVLLKGHQFALPKSFTMTGINNGNITIAYSSKPTITIVAICTERIAFPMAS